MKNKVSGSGDSIFKKKGFFIALYSCLGAVMVLALVISFTNLMTGPGNETARGPDGQTESQNVNTDRVDSYLAQEQARAQAELDEQAWKKPAPKPTATPQPTVRPSPAVTPTPYVPVPTATAQPATDTPGEAPSADPSSGATGATGATGEPERVDASDESGASDATGATENAAAVTNETDAVAFSPFTESDKLIWPVYGDIAMVFSTDKLVYDPTLDQYRTNDDLRIAAQEGTPVKACADGKVLEISNDHVYGNYIKIDHGNGWVTTYGQLMDGALVAQGDIVKTGQVIGGVGKPSLYGSLNGTHINLRVTKEDDPIDPRNLLADGE